MSRLCFPSFKTPPQQNDARLLILSETIYPTRMSSSPRPQGCSHLMFDPSVGVELLYGLSLRDCIPTFANALESQSRMTYALCSPK